MIVIKQETEFEATFNDAAADYDESRPTYCPALYQDLLAYKSVGLQSRVLEIGLGTGKATSPILETGCRLTALEPGAQLAHMAREKLGKHRNLTIIEKTLQDYECNDEMFDLIYAATAFHWIPEEYGYPRVFSLLKPGGVFARFAYHAGEDASRPTMTSAIQAVYARYPSLSGRYKPFAKDQVQAIAAIAEKYGFEEATYRLYHWQKDFTADGYMKLLRTYPNHMSLPADERKSLFAGIHEAIVQYGGTISVHYTADLELARKP